jgi:hypothetical protein
MLAARVTRRLAWLGTLAALLAGCSSQPIIPGLSTAASMRVEVELYKGPLSKSITVQAGELLGFIRESRSALSDLTASAIQYQLNPKALCRAHPERTDCRYLASANQSACQLLAVMPLDPDASSNYAGVESLCECLGAALSPGSRPGAPACPGAAGPAAVEALDPSRPQTGQAASVAAPPMSGPKPAAKTVRRARDSTLRKALEVLADSPAAPGTATVNRAALEYSIFAMRTKLKGFTEVFTTIPEGVADPVARRFLVDYSAVYSEIANQLDARTDVLLKQLALAGPTDAVPGRRLPISDHLRDSSTTDFINLYDWYETARGDQGGRLDVEAKVRMAQRLFSDHYWTKINEVHANGQGEVRMAFVKNDIGNWDLKSFDNNPEALLDAYRDMTLAGIEAATQAASGTAGISALAAKLTRGNVGVGTLQPGVPTPGTGQVEKAASHARVDLRSLKTRIESEGAAQAEAIERATKDYESATQAVEAAKAALEKTEDAIIDSSVPPAAVPPGDGGAATPAAPPAGMSPEQLHALRASQLQALASARATAADKRALVDAEQARTRQWAEAAVREARQVLAQHRRVLEVLRDVSDGR